MSALVLPRSITSGLVEDAYRHAKDAKREGRQAFAEKGMRMARARDPLFLKALQECAEKMTAIDDSQRGESRRQAGADFADKRYTTPTQLFTEAYRLADAGSPSNHFEWIYGAVAWILN